jgi:hypothetical protein
MKQSNEITRNALTSVQRAFVTFRNINVAGGIQCTADTKVPEGFRFYATWENTGSTPAKSVIMQFTGGPYPWPIDNYVLREGETRDKFHPSVIGPKGTLNSGLYSVRTEDLIGRPLKKTGTVMWGWVVYRDVFKGTKPHVTEFCQTIAALNAEPPQNVPVPKSFSIPVGSKINFELLSCPQHNCADEDCKDYAEVIARAK